MLNARAQLVANDKTISWLPDVGRPYGSGIAISQFCDIAEIGAGHVSKQPPFAEWDAVFASATDAIDRGKRLLADIEALVAESQPQEAPSEGEPEPCGSCGLHWLHLVACPRWGQFDPNPEEGDGE